MSPDEAAEIINLYPKPKTRAGCLNGPRPCPYISCRFHLYWDGDVNRFGVMVVNSGTPPEEMTETCALDVADRGEHTLEDIGALLDVTRERIRQIEGIALHAIRQKKRSRAAVQGLADLADMTLPHHRKTVL